MKVMQIGGTLTGAQKDIELSIHSYLDSKGIDNRILYAIGDDYDDAAIVRYETKIESYARRFCWKYLGHDDIYAYRQTQRIIKMIDEFKPDVVHLHTIHHGMVHFASLMNYLNTNKIKIVYTLHDFWPVTGGCYHYSALHCDNYLRDCSHCPSIENEFDCRRSATQKKLLKKKQIFSLACDITFVGVSQWVQNEAKRALGNGYDVQMIYNAVKPIDEIEVENYKNSPVVGDLIRFAKKRPIVVGVAASWTEKKGIYDFLKLSRLLGNDYCIVLVGGATERIKNQAPENMCFLGYISNRALLWQIYRHCDVYVSMSKEETFGMTFVEAALNGLYSVSYKSTAIPEILSKLHGTAVNELLPDKIASAVVKSIEQGKRLPECEIKEIDQLFSQRKMAGEYLKIYRELTDSQ